MTYFVKYLCNRNNYRCVFSKLAIFNEDGVILEMESERILYKQEIKKKNIVMEMISFKLGH